MTPPGGSSGPDWGVIIAGGGGTRLWPWTGPDMPKPLLPLGGGGRTLLRATLDRLEGVVARERVRLLAGPEIARTLRGATPGLGSDQVWVEPSPRDTGPAVALAMRRIWRENREAVVVIAPADHRVADEASFREALHAAAAAARGGSLVVLGVRPDHPATRFGYVDPGPALAGGPAGVRHVANFVEKPAAESARELVLRGALWNAGLFVWRADVFWNALERHAPGIASPVASVVDRVDQSAWERAERTSIDYALMERAEHVAVAPLDAGWDDVGGWDAVLPLVARGEAKGVVRLDVRGDDPAGSVVLRIGPTGEQSGVVLGREALLIVIGPRGILVTPRAEVDRVKGFV